MSKEALIRIFFLPLGVEQLGDMVAVVTSNNVSITKFFVRKNVDQNIVALGSNLSKSILRSDFTNPVNGVFDYARQCIEGVKTAAFAEESKIIDIMGVTINLFHFTNFGAKPTIRILTLPATVFAFYSFCLLEHRRDWNNFIYRQYISAKVKNATYNNQSQKWISSNKEIDFDEYRLWRNKAFECLQYEKTGSFRQLILKHSRTQIFNFQIVEQYQINIRNMDKRTLSKILELADFIIEQRSEEEIKKAITRINKQKSSNDLRRYLLKLVADYNREDSQKEKPLITLDEYTNYLFPDGIYWNEIRDLLLIAIYQRLHEMNKSVDLDIEEEFEN